MPIWCWHAVGNPRTPVFEDDYHACCGQGKAKYGFIICLLIDLIFLIACLVMAIQSNEQDRLLLILIIVVCLPITILGFISLITLKPIHMQIYWSIYIVQMGFTVLVIGFFMLILFFLPTSQFVEERQITKPSTISGIIVTLLLFLGVLIYVFWRGAVTYNYYQYIRDRQLAIEHHGSNLAHAADNLAHDVEKPPHLVVQAH